MNAMDHIVRLILGFIGTTFEIPRLVIKYVLGLIWTAYMFVRRRDFETIFSKLNDGMIDEIRWVLDEFKFFM